MPISEADLDLFMNGIAKLFTPWFPSPRTDKFLRTDEAGMPLYWEVAVQVPTVPLPLLAHVLRDSLVLVGPATMSYMNPKPGWSPAATGFEATVPLPAGSDPDLVNASVIGDPAVIKVEIPVGVVRVPVHGLAGRGGTGSTE